MEKFLETMHKVRKTLVIKGFQYNAPWIKAAEAVGEITKQEAQDFLKCNNLRNKIVHDVPHEDVSSLEQKWAELFLEKAINSKLQNS